MPTSSSTFCNTYMNFDQISLTAVWRTDCVRASRIRKLLPWTTQEMMVAWTVVKERDGWIWNRFWRQNRKIRCRTERKGGIKKNPTFSQRRLRGSRWCRLLRRRTRRRSGWRGKESRHGTWEHPVRRACGNLTWAACWRLKPPGNEHTEGTSSPRTGAFRERKQAHKRTDHWTRWLFLSKRGGDSTPEAGSGWRSSFLKSREEILLSGVGNVVGSSTDCATKAERERWALHLVTQKL